ncbi:hypothetical protein ACFHW1_05075 [Micromonospora sp. LOL_014]|uniref:hypothetical protein n=1 Tax=Micromonospora sp. LOL_014 TaxID=3345415 RepID=UPI003A84B170
MTELADLLAERYPTPRETTTVPRGVPARPARARLVARLVAAGLTPRAARAVAAGRRELAPGIRIEVDRE